MDKVWRTGTEGTPFLSSGLISINNSKYDETQINLGIIYFNRDQHKTPAM